MTPRTVQEFISIDFEASSLSAESWPIEIGLSWIDAEGAVQSWSSLIHPHPAWPREDWSLASAEIHGIPLSDLLQAPPAAEVARDALSIIAGRHLVSDAPEFEIRWIDRLFALIGLQGKIACHDYDAVTAHLLTDRQIDDAYERLHRMKAPHRSDLHRAGPDSRRLVTSWAYALGKTDLGMEP